MEKTRYSITSRRFYSAAWSPAFGVTTTALSRVLLLSVTLHRTADMVAKRRIHHDVAAVALPASVPSSTCTRGRLYSGLGAGREREVGETA